MKIERWFMIQLFPDCLRIIAEVQDVTREGKSARYRTRAVRGCLESGDLIPECWG